MRYKEIDSLKNFSKETFIIRIDTDIEIVEGKIVDDFRLKSSLATIEFIRSGGGKIILVGHLGRPSESDLTKSEFSLLPVAKWFEKEFNGRVQEINIDGFSGWSIADNIVLLENIRFYPGEEVDDNEFAEKLSSLGNIFVNEAFATAHRKHASTVGITKFLPSYAGFRFSLEVETLSKIIDKPERPLVIVIGGEKIETKLPLVEKMHQFAEYVLVGGKIADETKTLLEVAHRKTSGIKAVLLMAETVGEDDVTEKSIENFTQIIKWAKTVVWNGTMGNIALKNHLETTKKLANAIIGSESFSVVGGGDTVAFLTQENIRGFSFVSVGGGAMLAFLAGENLPSLNALSEDN